MDNIIMDLCVGGIAIRHLNTVFIIVDGIVIELNIIAVIEGYTAIPPIVVHLIVTDDGIVSTPTINVDAIPTVVIDVTAIDETVGRCDIEAVIKPA